MPKAATKGDPSKKVAYTVRAMHNDAAEMRKVATVQHAAAQQAHQAYLESLTEDQRKVQAEIDKATPFGTWAAPKHVGQRRHLTNWSARRNEPMEEWGGQSAS
jgi:hypothetical protein